MAQPPPPGHLSPPLSPASLTEQSPQSQAQAKQSSVHPLPVTARRGPTGTSAFSLSHHFGVGILETHSKR